MPEELPISKEVEHNWDRDHAFVRILGNRVSIVSMIKKCKGAMDPKKKRAAAIQKDMLFAFLLYLPALPFPI